MGFRITNKWLILTLLMVAYAISFMDRYVMNLLLDPIKADMHLTDTQVSLLAGAGFAVFYVLMGIPLGRLSDSKSRVKLIAGGLAVWSIMTSVCGLSKNYLQLMLARMGVGVGEAALSPSAYSMLADLFPRKLLATAIGIYSSGIYIGAGLAYIVGGSLLKYFEAHGTYNLPFVGEVFSWQMIFFLFGLPGLFIAVIMLFVKEPIRVYTNEKTSLTDFFHFLKNEGRPFLWLCAGGAVFNIAVYATGVWIPTFLSRVHQMPLPQVGSITGIGIMLLSPIGAILGGKLADTLATQYGLGGRLKALITFSVVFIPACIVYTLTPTITATLWALVPYAILVSSGVAVTAATAQEMVPVHFRGTASACMLFAQNIIGMGIGPTSVAFVTDYVYQDQLAVGQSLAVICTASLVLATGLFIICNRSFGTTTQTR